MAAEGGTYTISQAAERLGVTAYTLRYYDKEGLLPFVGRSQGGARVYGPGFGEPADHQLPEGLGNAHQGHPGIPALVCPGG